ncbi:MAG: DUF916 domain-containing protein [Actinobacteria bacterium]|nr:DUF916 domain-containing protein [Actinomycetota bacterium]
MNGRRLILSGAVAALALAVGVLVAPAAESQVSSTTATGPPGSIGIRLLDAPINRADDPRARLYIVDHLAPGTTIERRVEVSNDTTETRTISLYPAAATVADGVFQFGEGHAVNELTTWTTVAPSMLQLAPGAKGVATTTIKVDPKASPGERYAVVWAEVGAPAPPGGGIATVNRVGVRIYLSVGPGNEPASDFEITGLEAQRAQDGSPEVTATVHNTGGRAVDLSGDLRLTNGPGALAAGPFPAKLGTTLGVGQSEPVVVVLDRAVPNGPWDAEIILREGLIERKANARLTFPTAPAGVGTPVKARSEDRGVSPMALGGVGAALLLAAATLVPRRLRKRRPPSPPEE